MNCNANTQYAGFLWGLRTTDLMFNHVKYGGRNLGRYKEEYKTKFWN